MNTFRISKTMEVHVSLVPWVIFLWGLIWLTEAVAQGRHQWVYCKTSWRTVSVSQLVSATCWGLPYLVLQPQNSCTWLFQLLELLLLLLLLFKIHQLFTDLRVLLISAHSRKMNRDSTRGSAKLENAQHLKSLEWSSGTVAAVCRHPDFTQDG